MRFLNQLMSAGVFAAFAWAPAQAATVDSFSVDSADPAGIDSSYSFTLGTLYTIEVSGTIIYTDRTVSNPDEARADAEYFDLNTPKDLTSTGFDFGLGIAGMDVDWGPYSATNTYTYVTDLLSGIVNFRFNESSLGAYTDNIGSLQVTVSAPVAPIPLPAGLPLMLAGLGGLALVRRSRRA